MTDWGTYLDSPQYLNAVRAREKAMLDERAREQAMLDEQNRVYARVQGMLDEEDAAGAIAKPKLNKTAIKPWSLILSDNAKKRERMYKNQRGKTKRMRNYPKLNTIAEENNASSRKSRRRRR